MLSRLFSGIDLYQQKDPAFSREQRQLLFPKNIFLPIDTEEDEIPVSKCFDNIKLINEINLDYPGIIQDRFGNYKLEKSSDLFKNDYDEYDESKEIPKLTKDELIDIAKKAYIIDESDGVPLYKKLQNFFLTGVNFIIVDAVDDEPYISSNINTLIQKKSQVSTALRIVSETMYAHKTVFVYYEGNDNTKVHVPSKIADVEVKKISGRYPVKALLEEKIKKIFKKDKYFHGVIGVQALLHLYRAIFFKKKQTTTIITVAGDCIGYPCNVEVCLGTPIQEVLEFCSLVKDPSRVAIKGSLTGYNIKNYSLPVLHLTRGVITFKEQGKYRKLPCANCGKCISACPSKLIPGYIYKYYKYDDIENALDLEPQKCIECGCCSYICPANLELSETIISIKKSLNEEGELIEK